MLHSLLKFHALLETMYMIILSNLKKVGKICVGYPDVKRGGRGGKGVASDYAFPWLPDSLGLRDLINMGCQHRPIDY